VGIVAADRYGPASRLALLAIRGYQRWLSPYKGFRCAHAVLHGGPGCSGYAAEVIHARGLVDAVGPIRQRFRDCRAAYQVMSSQGSGKEERDEPGRRVDKSLVRKRYSDLPCGDCLCAGPPSKRSCLADTAGHFGCAACSPCDLGAT
jgi:putative component of membrane protein insertase Oxa1/YidC/SpoIIIJ protein YidD